jgi:hypothetical protein
VEGDITGTTYDVAADDQRFVIAGNPVVGGEQEEDPTARAVLVNNFIEVLRAQVPR